MACKLNRRVCLREKHHREVHGKSLPCAIPVCRSGAGGPQARPSVSCAGRTEHFDRTDFLNLSSPHVWQRIVRSFRPFFLPPFQTLFQTHSPLPCLVAAQTLRLWWPARSSRLLTAPGCASPSAGPGRPGAPRPRYAEAACQAVRCGAEPSRWLPCRRLPEGRALCGAGSGPRLRLLPPLEASVTLCAVITVVSTCVVVCKWWITCPLAFCRKGRCSSLATGARWLVHPHLLQPSCVKGWERFEVSKWRIWGENQVFRPKALVDKHQSYLHPSAVRKSLCKARATGIFHLLPRLWETQIPQRFPLLPREKVLQALGTAVDTEATAAAYRLDRALSSLI